MKFAFSKPTADEAEQRRLFSRFRAVGYSGLQLKFGQYEASLDHPESFRETWGQYPGAASALIYGGGLDDSGQEALRRVIAFAGGVGSERVVFCHGLGRQGLTDGDIRGFARVISGLGREAQRLGVALSLHHHYDQPVMHRADLDTFFDAADPGAIGLTVDTAHLVKSGVTDISGVLRDFRGVLDNIHLKDYADGEFAVLGRGQIHFAPVFAALDEISYDGWLCADEESGSELEHALTACVRFLTARGGVPPEPSLLDSPPAPG